MAREKKRECKMEGCYDSIKCSGLCANCYSYLWYWLKKKPGQVIKRQQRLELWQSRLATLMPTVRHISSAKTKRKRRRA